MEKIPIYFEKGSLADRWGDELGIEIGMSKEQALEKFREWRAKRKTCLRCEGERYISFCPIQLICKEADYVTDVAGSDYGARDVEIDEPETFRADIFEARERASLR